jgi:hypothetical protein
MPDSPVAFDDVEVVSATELAIRCRIAGKVVVVGSAQPLEGTTVRRAGDHGRLVLPRWAVVDLGLLDLAPAPDPPIILNGVLVTADTGDIYVCVHEGLRFLLPRTDMLPGTNVTKPGDRGRLVLAQSTARKLGLLPGGQPPSGSS